MYYCGVLSPLVARFRLSGDCGQNPPVLTQLQDKGGGSSMGCSLTPSWTAGGRLCSGGGGPCVPVCFPLGLAWSMFPVTFVSFCSNNKTHG